MTRKIYLPSFVAIGWVVPTLSWDQAKFCPASVAERPWSWRKVTEMGTKNFSHTHRLAMCGLKKLASGVFLERWKVSAERRPQQWRGRQWRKWTKNNKSQGYPWWLKYQNYQGHLDIFYDISLCARVLLVWIHKSQYDQPFCQPITDLPTFEFFF